MRNHRRIRISCAIVLAAVIGCRAAAPDAPGGTPTLPTSAQAGGTSIVAIAPPAQPCCPKQTLPQFLGITGVAKGIAGIIDRIRNRLGSIWPGLEAKPEVLAISDPKNLESPNPAVAAAAGVKAEEDAAAQKAKAIAYLASVGCAGCYPGIEEALLAALDDCTELVRFETAKALRSTALYPCKNCCRSACCGPKIREKLMKMAYETDEQGCFLESSDRVRRMARLALANCTCVPEKPTSTPTLPEEGPLAEDVPTSAAGPPPIAGTASVLRQPGENAPRVGSGVAAEVPAPRPPTNSASGQPVNYEEALRGVTSRESARRPEALEVSWEIWTARPGDFATREAALTALMVARTQIMSSQPGRFVPPPFVHGSYEWTDPVKMPSSQVAQAVATVPVGGVSGPIEDLAGWHLVRVLGRRAAPTPTPAAYASAPAANQPSATQPPIAPLGGTRSVLSGETRPVRPAAAAALTVRLPDCNCK